MFLTCSSEEFNDTATSVFLRDLEENHLAQTTEPSSRLAPAAQFEQLEDWESISSYAILLLIVLAFQEKIENNITALSHKVEGMNHSLERIHDKLVNISGFFLRPLKQLVCLLHCCFVIRSEAFEDFNPILSR
jgi:hypothetical protein